MEVKTVKIVCAWCKTELGTSTGKHICDTHGICNDCRKWALREAQIAEKIASGYYDSETILNVVAAEILDDLRNPLNQIGEGFGTGM
mgnify:CR=1 FL=1